jgi:hypothetical protein
VDKWEKYLRGDANRQDFLAIALDWVSDGNVSDYMAKHRDSADISAMQNHFNDVIDWIGTVFTDTYKEMKGLDWGRLYDEYGSTAYDAVKVAERVEDLYADESVTAKKGIFEYVLGGEVDTKLLNVRLFSDGVKAAAYRKQTDAANVVGNVSNCSLCAVGGNANATRVYLRKEMEADHVTAWSLGGASDLDNCEMLCKPHNGAKGNR